MTAGEWMSIIDRMSDQDVDHHLLAQRVTQGDRQALADLFETNRRRLRNAVALRLDARLHGRIDPSDVLQESYLEASERLPEFVQQASMPPFLWLRFLTMQRLLILHRRHLGAQARDVRREIQLGNNVSLAVSSVAFAAQLIDSGISPSGMAIRAEESDGLHEAMDRLEPLDREVLAMRHFEQLNNAETAQVLGASLAAASQRYYRALKRLKEILENRPSIHSLSNPDS